MIGINTAILAGTTGLGFAIPINVAVDVAEQILTTGRVRRAYLGIDYIEIDPTIAERFNLPVEEGLVVTEIGRNSPAARGGLRVEDFLVGFNAAPSPTPATWSATCARPRRERPCAWRSFGAGGGRR